MDILTESDLRSGKVKRKDNKVCVKTGTFITPLAKEYMRDNGIELEFSDSHKSDGKGSFGRRNELYADSKIGRSPLYRL